jgi:hypothetical protein
LRSSLLLSALVGCAGPDPADPLAVEGLTAIPSAAGRGQTVDVHLSTLSPVFEGEVGVDLGPGVTVGPVTVEDAYTAVVTVTVGAEATEGGRDLTIASSAWSDTVANAFAVTTAGITVSPSAWPAGEVATVAITGHGTTWTAHDAAVEVGPGLVLLDWEVLSDTSATARVAAETQGWREIVVQGTDGLAPRAAVGIRPREASAQLIPDEVAQGASVEFRVEADGVALAQPALELVGDEAVGLDVRLRSDGQGSLASAWEAPPGVRSAVLSAGGRELWMPRAFEVLDAPRDPADLGADLVFGIDREIGPDGTWTEVVTVEASFPYDNACGPGAAPPGAGPHVADEAGVFAIPPPPEPPSEPCLPDELADLGDAIWLASGSRSITLVPEAAAGGVVYRAQAPTLDDYGFGESYTLTAPGGPEASAMVLADVVRTVPADFALTTPPAEWSRDQDLVLRWTPALTYPDAWLILTIEGTLAQTGGPGFVGAILVDDGEFVVPASALSGLEPGRVELELFALAEASPVALPSGVVQFDSIVTWRAPIDLR